MPLHTLPFALLTTSHHFCFNSPSFGNLFNVYAKNNVILNLEKIYIEITTISKNKVNYTHLNVFFAESVTPLLFSHG